MNIFISHSSVDKWAARWISRDLELLGGKCFLDEKSIRTGESIDETIRISLSDCEDFMILLTPASIKSEWVLIELGGALALKKRIIPILLYLGTNEIPQVISLKLARDINDIEGYYNEIKDRIAGRIIPKPKKKKVKQLIPKNLQIGDQVLISKPTDERYYSDKESIIPWNDEIMDKYSGREAVIIEPSKLGNDVYHLDIDDGELHWALPWLLSAT